MNQELNHLFAFLSGAAISVAVSCWVSYGRHRCGFGGEPELPPLPMARGERPSRAAWSPKLGMFATVRNVGGSMFVETSPDGHDWARRVNIGPCEVIEVCWADYAESFIVLTRTGDSYTSHDGVRWTTFRCD